MNYRKLGQTDITVSELCLGTMTYGDQNTEQEAHEQLDYALERGINFIDTAELYPVPPMAQTQGRTEAYIGSWLKKRGRRDDVILASKVVGPGEFVAHIRNQPRLSSAHIHEAIEQSLTRLNTDYLDLYQLHWPDRNTNYFGQLGYSHNEVTPETDLEETLSALKDLVDAGKVRYIGLSNETPWGLMKCLELSQRLNLPRVVSVQNPYNLLNRSYEIGLAEISHREQAGLLAYSPMAFGVLSGKYLNNQWPEKARITLYKRFSRYLTDNGIKATQAYVDLANESGLNPAQMALAFVTGRSFVTSNIIGATRMDQLKTNIDSAELKLTDDVLEKIEQIHTQIPNPCP